ncbi:hypothetical protein V0M98_35970 (plasmid) [Pseudomonas silesiensis]|uniref:hypothetical protein n=1 Tax=Pseudomonas silesiensis TaxID=1853130 RepID=UPI0030CCCA52
MNKACAPSNIKAITVWQYQSSELVVSVCAETQAQFRDRLNTIIKCEIADFLASADRDSAGADPVNWSQFDLMNSLVFPKFKGTTVYSYGGNGLIHAYDLSMLKPSLRTTKGKKLKDFQQSVGKFTNVVKSISFNDLHQVMIQYQGELLLTLHAKERQLNWFTAEEMHETLTFEDAESAEGLMVALERYGETGEIDDAYTMFMLTPFDLHKEEMNLNQRGRLFAIDLGL